jgi:hypothetical protein
MISGRVPKTNTIVDWFVCSFIDFHNHVPDLTQHEGTKQAKRSEQDPKPTADRSPLVERTCGLIQVGCLKSKPTTNQQQQHTRNAEEQQRMTVTNQLQYKHDNS